MFTFFLDDATFEAGLSQKLFVTVSLCTPVGCMKSVKELLHGLTMETTHHHALEDRCKCTNLVDQSGFWSAQLV